MMSVICVLKDFTVTFMTSSRRTLTYRILTALALIGLLAGCMPQSSSGYIIVTTPTATAEPQRFTPEPTRPAYAPGELVDYTAQPGDTLLSLAAHFNTTQDEIRAANPILPADVTTMPPGMPMKIPIYYEPLWGSAYRILPDSLFANGPAQVGFDTAGFIAQHPGWLNGYSEFSFDAMHTSSQIIDYVALQWSVSPRLLLALLEFHGGGLSQPVAAAGVRVYPLGYRNYAYKGLYLQLIYAANFLNNAYYPYRDGSLDRFDHLDGSEERIDPWQNAASVALMLYYARYLDGYNYRFATGPDGLAKTYAGLFGDPWAADQPHIPGSLTQPDLQLPFASRETWV
jgi:LysM repeat protein